MTAETGTVALAVVAGLSWLAAVVCAQRAGGRGAAGAIGWGAVSTLAVTGAFLTAHLGGLS